MLKKTCLLLTPVGLGGLLGKHIIDRKKQFEVEQEIKRKTMRFRPDGVRELTHAHLAKLSGNIQPARDATSPSLDQSYHNSDHNEEQANTTNYASNLKEEEEKSPLRVDHSEQLDLSDLRFTVTGSLFQSLVSDKNKDSTIDVWPRTTEDELKLVERLNDFKNVCYSDESESMYEFVIECADGSLNRVDIFKHSNIQDRSQKKSERSLSDVIKSFDIALTAVGAEVMDGKINDVKIHSKATDSVLEKKPFICEPLANPSFLLTTCERVLTISDQMEWPFPADQVSRLITLYAQKSPELRERMYQNYQLTSVDEQKRSLVCKMFQVEEFVT